MTKSMRRLVKMSVFLTWFNLLMSCVWVALAGLYAYAGDYGWTAYFCFFSGLMLSMHRFNLYGDEKWRATFKDLDLSVGINYAELVDKIKKLKELDSSSPTFINDLEAIKKSYEDDLL